MSIKTQRRVTAAEYLTQQIEICGKSQKEIADEIGYDKPNIITMFKQGKTRIPTDKVPAIAKAVGVDPLHFLRVVMSEYQPETWAILEGVLGQVTTENENKILDIVRKVSCGFDIAPETEQERIELGEYILKLRLKAEKSAGASKRRFQSEVRRKGANDAEATELSNDVVALLAS